MSSAMGYGVLLNAWHEVLQIHYYSSLKVRVTMNLDGIRPSMNITASISLITPDECSSHIAGDDSESSDSALDDTGFEQEVEIILGRGSSIDWVIPTAGAASLSDEGFAKIVNNLPATTRLEIERMRSPVLVRFLNGKHCKVTQNLCLRRPPWAEDLYRDILREANSHTIMLLDADVPFISKLASLQPHLNPPTSVARESHRRVNPLERIRNERFDVSQTLRDIRNFTKTNSFVDMREYTYVQGAALMLDKSQEVKEMIEYQTESQYMCLLSKESRQRANSTIEYFGLIEKPEGTAFSLEAGTKLKILFDEDEKSPAWFATVTEKQVLSRENMVSIFVTRGKYHDSDLYDERSPPSVTYAQGNNMRVVQAQVRTASCTRVHVRIVECNVSFTSIRTALESMNGRVPQQNVPFQYCDYRTRMNDIVLGRGLDNMPLMDLYASANLHIDPRDFMGNLNDDQDRVIGNSRCARGGIVIVQGPPGTGKTYLATQMIAGLLASKKDHLILVGAPTNRGADDLTSSLRKVWHRLINKHRLSHLKRRPVLRIVRQQTELDIVRSYNAHPPSNPGNGSAALLGQGGLPAIQSVSGASNLATKRRDGLAGFFEEQSTSSNSKSTGIQDARVQDPEISVGYMMLMISGIIPNTLHADADAQKYASFRALHLKQKTEKLTSDDHKEWEKTCANLFNVALSRASVLVGTTEGITSRFVLPRIESRVAAIFLDENAFQTEIGMTPLFAANFRLNPCLVVLGDQQQIAPITTKFGVVDNPLRSQLELSFMGRMVNLGMEYMMLREQYRMVPDIVSICNSITYGGQLTTASSAQLPDRPIAKQFQDFARKYVNKPTNRFMIDVPPSCANQTTRDRSKSNDFFIAVVTKLVEELLGEFKTTARVAILTPYRIQREKYVRVTQNMEKDELPNHEMISVNSFVGSQGREYDIVVVEVIVDTHLGFMRDQELMNVAMSRAKNGLIFVCNKTALEAAMVKPTKAVGCVQHLRTLLRLFEDVTYVRPKEDQVPPNRYYTASSSHVAAETG